MMLCLDAGNSRVKWGLRATGTWRAQGACAHADITSLATRLPAAPDRVIACNVAGDKVAEQIAALARSLAIPLAWWHSASAVLDVSNGYQAPGQLGADRWAALVGARGLHAGPAVVVMAGTATTIDALDGDGRFLGGLILPGIALMRQALARNTAGLPEAQGTHRDYPANTGDAIVSGSIEATAGAIERMVRRLSCRPAGADFLCLLSGGAAGALAPHLSQPFMQVDNLVLEGLARVAESGDLL